MDRCFRQLKGTFENTAQLLELARDKPWEYQHESVILRVPDELGDLCSTLKQLRESFEGSKYFLLKSEPYTFYSWHTDSVRGCAVNMLLQGFDSHSDFYIGHRKDLMHTIQPLRYQPSKLYLYNTSVDHSMTNYAGERLLFSMTIYKPITYRQVVERCEELGVLEASQDK